MFKITAGETEIARSRNYEIVKRKARKKADISPDYWLEVFTLYKDNTPIETGEIISKRISWEMIDGSNT